MCLGIPQGRPFTHPALTVFQFPLPQHSLNLFGRWWLIYGSIGGRDLAFDSLEMTGSLLKLNTSVGVFLWSL